MRLIDADALLNREVYYDRAECLVLRYEIEKAPTIDAVPVVRCKDCKNSGMYCFGTSKEPVLACLEVEEDGFVRFATGTEPDHFCSYGERKEHDQL